MTEAVSSVVGRFGLQGWIAEVAKQIEKRLEHEPATAVVDITKTLRDRAQAIGVAQGGWTEEGCENLAQTIVGRPSGLTIGSILAAALPAGREGAVSVFYPVSSPPDPARAAPEDAILSNATTQATAAQRQQRPLQERAPARDFNEALDRISRLSDPEELESLLPGLKKLLGAEDGRHLDLGAASSTLQVLSQWLEHPMVSPLLEWLAEGLRRNLKGTAVDRERARSALADLIRIKSAATHARAASRALSGMDALIRAVLPHVDDDVARRLMSSRSEPAAHVEQPPSDTASELRPQQTQPKVARRAESKPTPPRVGSREAPLRIDGEHANAANACLDKLEQLKRDELHVTGDARPLEQSLESSGYRLVEDQAEGKGRYLVLLGQDRAIDAFDEPATLVATTDNAAATTAVTAATIATTAPQPTTTTSTTGMTPVEPEVVPQPQQAALGLPDVGAEPAAIGSQPADGWEDAPSGKCRWRVMPPTAGAPDSAHYEVLPAQAGKSMHAVSVPWMPGGRYHQVSSEGGPLGPVSTLNNLNMALSNNDPACLATQDEWDTFSAVLPRHEQMSEWLAFNNAHPARPRLEHASGRRVEEQQEGVFRIGGRTVVRLDLQEPVRREIDRTQAVAVAFGIGGHEPPLLRQMVIVSAGHRLFRVLDSAVQHAAVDTEPLRAGTMSDAILGVVQELVPASPSGTVEILFPQGAELPREVAPSASHTLQRVSAAQTADATPAGTAQPAESPSTDASASVAQVEPSRPEAQPSDEAPKLEQLTDQELATQVERAAADASGASREATVKALVNDVKRRVDTGAAPTPAVLGQLVCGLSACLAVGECRSAVVEALLALSARVEANFVATANTLDATLSAQGKGGCNPHSTEHQQASDMALCMRVLRSRQTFGPTAVRLRNFPATRCPYRTPRLDRGASADAVVTLRGCCSPRRGISPVRQGEFRRGRQCVACTACARRPRQTVSLAEHDRATTRLGGHPGQDGTGPLR